VRLEVVNGVLFLFGGLRILKFWLEKKMGRLGFRFVRKKKWLAEFIVKHGMAPCATFNAPWRNDLV
jgi:hypothetical protein